MIFQNLTKIDNIELLKQCINFCFCDPENEDIRRRVNVAFWVEYERIGASGTAGALEAKECIFRLPDRLNDLDNINNALWLDRIGGKPATIKTILPINNGMYFVTHIPKVPENYNHTIYDLYTQTIAELERQHKHLPRIFVGVQEFRGHTYNLLAPEGDLLDMDNKLFEVVNQTTEQALPNSPNRTAIINRFKKKLK